MGRAPTQTKQKLIDTARELIWSESYNSVSVDEICKKADVKKGSFYHYFPSKSDLAIETIDQALDEMTEKYNDFFSAARDPQERFHLMTRYVVDQQKELHKELGHVCGCPFATLGSEMAYQDCSLAAKIKDACAVKSKYYQSALRDLVAQGLISAKTDIEAKASEVFSFIIGMLLMARINDDLNYLDKNLERALYDLIGLKQN